MLQKRVMLLIAGKRSRGLIMNYKSHNISKHIFIVPSSALEAFLNPTDDI